MERDPLDISDGLLSGRLSIEDHLPVSMTTGSRALELADGLAFVESFANVAAVRGGGGFAIIDTGSPWLAQGIHDVIRAWTTTALSHAVYTHGHVDHCFGVPAFEAEQGAPPVEVVAHEAVPARFDRYRMTLGYNGIINQRQFRLEAPLFPEDFRYPDRTYRVSTTVSLGDLELELHHDKGETDDHTWVWIPDHAALCTGDLFIWVAPNCGNPQKAQRYPIEWAAALRKMQRLDAEILLPGHGLPIRGATHVSQVLGDTAELLESISTQTLELMNAGARLNDIVHGVRTPDGLLDRPWLRPVYDDPEFIVHNIWRLYGGWYDGDPSHLKPSPAGHLATEIVRLTGGMTTLLARASDLAAEGDLRLAGHLAEFATQAEPENPGAHAVRTEINRLRVAEETSLIAKGIFGWAEHESDALTGTPSGEERAPSDEGGEPA